MKASVAAMVTAAERLVAAQPGHPGSIALLLTSDEEGDAVDGTVAVVETLQRRGRDDRRVHRRRADLVRAFRRHDQERPARIAQRQPAVNGRQCHIAYPERGRNPIHAALPALADAAGDRVGTRQCVLSAHELPDFEHACRHGRPATSFPARWRSGSISASRRHRPLTGSRRACVRCSTDRACDYDLVVGRFREPFMTAPGPLLDALGRAIAEVAGVEPELSTGGGTSDGRFLARVAREVVEFGPVAVAMHGADERVRIDDLGPLSVIYERTVAALLSA